LTSFAQLGVTRLGAQRALISLFDRTHQHVIAEATPTLSLVDGTFRDDRDRLRLGCCVLPKESGFCHHVERLPSSGSIENSAAFGGSALVISDVTDDERFRPGRLLHAFSDVRFYAAVPIVSPQGFTIGAYSIMDSEARTSGLQGHSLLFMKDMAATIMEHLVMVGSTRKSRQAERMMVGLGSFVEGKSTLRDSWREANTQYASSEHSGKPTEGQLNIQQQYIQESARGTDEKTLVLLESVRRDGHTSRRPLDQSNNMADRSRGPRMESTQSKTSIRSSTADDILQETCLSTNIKIVFSRAANLIRESIGAEGVIFLDADSDRFGSLIDHMSSRVSDSGAKESSGDESTDSGSSSRRKGGEFDSTSLCACLGFASSRGSSINDDSVPHPELLMHEPLLRALLQRYPHGEIFSYNAERSPSNYSHGTAQNLINSEHDSTTNVSHHNERRHSPNNLKLKPTYPRDADHLIKILPDARNILLLPVWDSEKRRCTAGTLVWTNDPQRIFTHEIELVYISAFTNSVMAEIHRLDVEMADKAKTKLVHSITHELRTPLHGILGTADILGDTAMNAMQYEMVHTVESCGRTLLDIINNLLDLSFIDKYQKEPSRVSRNGGAGQDDMSFSSIKGGRVQSKDSGETASSSPVKLDEVLEEVIESVYAGYSFYTHPNAPPPALAGSSTRSAGPASAFDQVGSNASQITIILDIQPETQWDFLTHAGAWRRILMNIFGNALKYTPSGYIYLGLRSSKSRAPRSHMRSIIEAPGEEGHDYDVTLTVKDTGKGIGHEFLQNDLFTPFMQEDPLTSGNGLGLSIVHQAVGSLGGSIEINSTKGVGTELLVRVPLIRHPGISADSSDSVLNTLLHTEGKTIGLVGFGSSLRSQRDKALFSALERLCCDWFGLKMTSVSALEDEHVGFDFYIAVQTELDSEDIEGRKLFTSCKHFDDENGCSSPVVVICQSPREAHSMFVAAKNRDEVSSFEFISQPCGPRKLSRALDLCMKRRLDRQSGRPSSDETTRWVEMPESYHLPLDVDTSDSPEERMKIRKRSITDPIPSSEFRTNRLSSTEQSRRLDSRGISQPTSSSNEGQGIVAPSSPSILLVDDNEVNLQLLCAYTKKGSFEYMTARNGAEAVATYEAYPCQFRVIFLGMSKRFLLFPSFIRSFESIPLYSLLLILVISDITMPIMDGFEAARQIRRLEEEHRARLSESVRQALPPTIIAALTGLHSPAAQKEAFGSGIDTFLIKPIKRSDLYAVLQRLKETP
jgi:signal transduction histidine kinase/CheY-like chemotaxis protein